MSAIFGLSANSGGRVAGDNVTSLKGAAVRRRLYDFPTEIIPQNGGVDTQDRSMLYISGVGAGEVCFNQQFAIFWGRMLLGVEDFEGEGFVDV